MDIKEILSKVDHTLLRPEATWNQIKNICDEGIKYNTASVCIPPSFVKQAAEYVDGKIAICTVIGFPNGYNTTEVKCYEAQSAVKDGASEIDMVINAGRLKDKDYNYIVDEISKIKAFCQGRNLKVILETDLLTKDEIKKACELCIQGGADFVKTSTGFVKNGVGAKEEDVKLMYETVKDAGLKVKASGGIRDKEAAIKMIEAGASRLGTSSGAKICS